MYEKTVKYTDYNGKQREETVLFNLNESEITEMEFGEHGGLSAIMKKAVDTDDTPTLIKYFKDLVLKAYGEKSEDGRRFVKNDKMREEFSQTIAYSNIFMELAFDDKAAAEFVNGIMPKELADRLNDE